MKLILTLCFLFCSYFSFSQWPEDGDFHHQHALALDKLVKEKNRFVSSLNEDMTIDLPVGIRKHIGNMDYTILIDSISFNSEGGFLTAYLVLDPPGSPPLTFRGTGIRFSASGGLQGEGELQLIGNHDIELGSGMNLTINGKTTRAIWDCEGFRRVDLDGVLEISRKHLIPENRRGRVISGNVTVDVLASVFDWSDIILDVRMPAFQLPKLPDFSFKPGSVTLDLSDIANSTLTDLPHSYSALLGDEIDLWKGLFISDLEIRLPQYFAEGRQRPSVRARNLIIDDSGVSVDVAAKNVLDINDGNLEGWAISIADMQLKILQGNFVKSSLAGGITLPLMQQAETVAYKALVDAEGKMHFNLSPEGRIDLPAFGNASAMLYPSSSIQILIHEDRSAQVSTRLSGELSLGGVEDSFSHLDMRSIRFESLELSSRAPFVSGGIFDFSGANRSVAGFPVQLEEIGFISTSDDQFALAIGFDLSLTKAEDGAFAASTSMRFNINTSDRGHWQFAGIQLDEAQIDIDAGPLSMRGKVAYFEESRDYGNGFSGKVNAAIEPGIEVEAEALFGNMEDFRYWYLQAGMIFPSGVPIAAGIAAYGINGGGAFHMRSELTEYGQLRYIPDVDQGLGFKAGLNLGTVANRNSFNADVALEMKFNTNGGLTSLTLQGTANFMEPPRQLTKVGLSGFVNSGYSRKTPRGQVSGDLLLHYDGPAKTFHGNIEVFVNAAGSTIQGTGPDFLAGKAVLHFSPDDWYIHIGNPQERIGLALGVGGLSVQADGYFMAGTVMPDAPPPPDIVSEILGGVDINTMRDLNSLASGSGFSLGTSFSMNTGEKRFLIFFAQLQAGVGFDLMLKDYGEEAFCTGNTDKLGVNGWYATGQAYGYFQGAIGIEINLPFANGRYKIIDLGTAVLLQAQLPNPTWLSGTVGGYFEVLNGLVKGNCQFRLEIGEKCDFSEYMSLSGLKVIAAMSPVEGSGEVDVFASPQVAFNLPVNREFTVEDIEGNQRKYKVMVDRLDVLQDGIPLEGEIELSADNTVGVFKSRDIMKPHAIHEFRVDLSFYEQRGALWNPLIRAGKPIRENRTVKFTTGEAPLHIPRDNIAFSYPVIDQVNFYPTITSQGYIQLKKGQPSLFDSRENVFIRLTTDSHDAVEVAVEYRDGRISFPLTTKMNLKSDYTLSLLTRMESDEINENLQSAYRNINASAELREITLEGNIRRAEESELLAYDFTTSAYPDFVSKVNSLSMTSFFLVPGDTWYLKRLRIDYAGTELFVPREYVSGMVRGAAHLTGSQYYHGDIFPIVYKGYPIDGDITVDRDTVSLGLPPVRAISMSSTPATTRFFWDLTPVMAKDFQDIQRKVVRRYISSRTSSSRIQEIILGKYPFVMYGNLDIDLGYYLPGEDLPVQKAKLRFNLPREY